MVALRFRFEVMIFSLELEELQYIRLKAIDDGLKYLYQMIHTTSGFVILAEFDDLDRIDSLGMIYIEPVDDEDFY